MVECVLEDSRISTGEREDSGQGPSVPLLLPATHMSRLGDCLLQTRKINLMILMLTPSNRVLFTAFEWLPTRRSRMFQPFCIRVMSVCFDICSEEQQYLQRYVETRISIFPFLAPRAFLSTSDQLCAIKLSVRRVFSVAVLITSFAC